MPSGHLDYPSGYVNHLPDVRAVYIIDYIECLKVETIYLDVWIVYLYVYAVRLSVYLEGPAVKTVCLRGTAVVWLVV